MSKSVYLLCLLLSLYSSSFAISHKAYTKRLKTALKADKADKFFRLYEKNYLKTCKTLLASKDKENFDKLRRINRQYRFNKLIEANQLSELPPILLTLLKNEVLWSGLVDQVQDKDVFPKVLDHIATIHKLDPKDFEKFYKLTLAIAVVWDTKRPKIHHQIGRKFLDYKTTVSDIYNYYKELYSSSKRAIHLKKLSTNDLVFVVDTPVPITELEWALKEVRGKAKKWGSHYSAIKYDTPRLAANQMTWPQYNGDYSLENIDEFGGICVDQAYFTVISGRAHGIPSMFFTGSGRDGGHAWAGIFLAKNDWNTEIGKYEQSNFAVGTTRNPQTDEMLSNHDLELSCNRKYSRSSYLKSKPYIEATANLSKLKQEKLAFQFASFAKKQAPLYEQPWLAIELFYKTQKKVELLEKLFKDKLRLFKKYPDIYTSTERSYALWLLEQKQGEAAEKILKKRFKKGKGDRIDLMWGNALAYYKIFEDAKNIKDATKTLERFISDNYKEMSNIFPAFNEYYHFAKRNKLEKDSCSFVKKIYEKMIRLSSPLNREALMQIMIKFYKLEKDQRGEKKIKKDLEKFHKKKAKETARSKRKDKRRQQEDSDYNY